MKSLIVHPKDPTTDFLSPIYAPLKDRTVIKGGISKSDLRELIESHERIIMLGHGSPYGLLSRGQFLEAGLYIIDDSMASVLMKNSNSMFVWCHANQFVQTNELSGLCTGMFISELGEADYWGFEDIEESLIDQSNYRFAFLVSKYIYEPLEVLYLRLLEEYKLLSHTNPIAKFNLERLYLTSGKNIKSQNKLTA